MKRFANLSKALSKEKDKKKKPKASKSYKNLAKKAYY